jgi:hypothetical protein
LVALVFLARSAGKVGGTFLAIRFTRASQKLKRYNGLALLPSAGFAIDLILEAQNNPLANTDTSLIMASQLYPIMFQNKFEFKVIKNCLSP